MAIVKCENCKVVIDLGGVHRCLPFDVTPTQAARAAFGGYAAMDAPELPEGAMARLQVMGRRWSENKDDGQARPL